jgi:DNA-binding Lrp family transcriptional regulator
MVDDPLDNVDRAILFELQRDARNNTNADIAERIDVSASTVGKRIAQLETEGVLRGYDPDIDYERAGFPLQVLFICTVSITEREALIQEALEIDTVVNVREMMTGEGNVHIQVVGRTNDDITRSAHRIDALGFTVTDEILMRDEYTRPSIMFDEPKSEMAPQDREP